MNFRKIFSLTVLAALSLPLMANRPDTTATGEIIKTGTNFGLLPVVAFDADKGFQYGGLVNIYNFGNGDTYPNPRSSWYLEASAYTGGGQKYIVSYDDKYLIPGVRMCSAASLMYDKGMTFYGFNGYQSIYDPEMPNSFYFFTRTTANFKLDFIGKITKNLYWEAGYHFNYFKTGNYSDTDDITLFELYNQWGILPDNELKGGLSSALRLGLVYDSRDYEAAPSRGIWADAHLIAAPEFLGTTHGYNKVNVTFRHYIPLMKDKLVFAYRLNYQGFLGNDAPWYVMPYLTVVGPMYDREAIGGYRTVRGLMLNRVQGLHTAFYNAELRWRFWDFTIWGQNISLALSGFCDGAATIKGVDLTNRTGAMPELHERFIDNSIAERLHVAAGGGIRFIMNRNFIVAAEYARCIDPQDGKGAFYLNTGFLF